MHHMSNKHYRRKPRTININGFEVPEPVREQLKGNVRYFIPDLYSEDFVQHERWLWVTDDINNLNRGLIHLTREAAELHAKALLSFTEQTK